MKRILISIIFAMSLISLFGCSNNYERVDLFPVTEAENVPYIELITNEDEEIVRFNSEHAIEECNIDKVTIIETYYGENPHANRYENGQWELFVPAGKILDLR